MRLIHAPEVLVGAEHDHFIVDCSVSFRTLEALNSVVNRSISRVQLEAFVRLNDRCLPAAVVQIKVDLEHVVSLDSTELVRVVWPRLLFQIFALDDLQVVCQESLFHRREAKSRGRN